MIHGALCLDLGSLFIFLLAHSREAFLQDTPEAMTLLCLAKREKQILWAKLDLTQQKYTQRRTYQFILACVVKAKQVNVSLSFSQTQNSIQAYFET